jgi:predicted RecA/RadA family phage recombinase
MKNYVQKGENITVTSATAASSGEIVKIGSMIGIAAGDAAIGDDLDLVTTGVFELPKVSTDALAVGDTVYFKSADDAVTSTASGNTKMGVAVTAAGNPSGTVNVRLNGTF